MVKHPKHFTSYITCGSNFFNMYLVLMEFFWSYILIPININESKCAKYFINTIFQTTSIKNSPISSILCLYMVKYDYVKEQRKGDTFNNILVLLKEFGPMFIKAKIIIIYVQSRGIMMQWLQTRMTLKDWVVC